MKIKTPLNEAELENFVLQHIASWVEKDEGQSFHNCPHIFRSRMDRFTNSFRSKWFDYARDHNLDPR